jgi:hypothetical protein
VNVLSWYGPAERDTILVSNHSVNLANRLGLPNGVDQDAHVELVDPLPRVVHLLLADLPKPLGVLCGGELQMNGMHALKSGEQLRETGSGPLCEGY